MITGKNAWDFAKGCSLRLPFGFAAYYRMTKYSEWVPAEGYRWSAMRDYYYEHGKNTGKHTLEVCLSMKMSGCKYAVPYFLLEMNKFDFDHLGFEFINESIDI